MEGRAKGKGRVGHGATLGEEAGRRGFWVRVEGAHGEAWDGRSAMLKTDSRARRGTG